MADRGEIDTPTFVVSNSSARNSLPEA
jgi:hypothetical protein